MSSKKPSGRMEEKSPQDKEKNITRREFLKKAFFAGAGLAAGGLALDYVLKSKNTTQIAALVNPNLKEALFYEKEGGIVRCALCPNRCTITEGSRGACGVRTNNLGRLYTLGYANPCAVHIDPIEKKPLFHFLPQSQTYSIGIAGCSLRCKYCQNYEISQAKPDDTSNIDLPPDEAASRARAQGAASIAYTYTEPTVFYEYMIDTAKAAHKEGIKNVLVSCGYVNPDPLKELCKYIDGANVNLKGFSEEFYSNLTRGRLAPILDSIRIIKEQGRWLELTYLVIPQWSDDDTQISGFIKWVNENLGPDQPIHFLRFMPAYRLSNLPPTPPETLLAARRKALEAGMEYVYVGNLGGEGLEDTFCPQCKKAIIKRRIFSVTENNIENGKCRFCKKSIPGYWA